MTILEDRTAYLDDLLRRIAGSIQLDDTRRGRAEQSYATLTELLENAFLEMATPFNHFPANKTDHFGHNVPVVGTDLYFQSVTGTGSSFVGL